MSIRIYGILALATLLSACANSTRPGAVGINRSQLMVASSEEVNRISAASFNEQNQKAKEKTIPIRPATTASPIDRPKPKIQAAIEIPKIDTFDAAQGQNWSFGLP